MNLEAAKSETNLTQAQSERRGLHTAIKQLTRLADRIENGGSPPEEEKKPVAEDESLAQFLSSLPSSLAEMTKSINDVRERIRGLLL